MVLSTSFDYLLCWCKHSLFKAKKRVGKKYDMGCIRFQQFTEKFVILLISDQLDLKYADDTLFLNS